MFKQISAAAACCALAMFGAAPALAGGPPTTTTLTGGPAFVGTPVTLTATITPSSPTCAGNVNFQELPGPVALVCTGGNPAAISANAATCQTTFGAAGAHSLRGVYGSTSGACTGSTSATFVLNVGSSVPTLGQWAMLLLAGSLMAAGMIVMARRSRALPPA